jgi:signal recognition particle subunit SEC65
MLTNKQRNKVKAKALEFGFPEEIAQKISTNAEVLSIDNAYDLLFDTFQWSESPEGTRYWFNVYKTLNIDFQSYREPCTPRFSWESKEITQSEKQQLLSILRESLENAVFGRDLCKRKAGYAWTLAEKGTPQGEFNFQLFSEINKEAKKYKKEVSKISNLIKKVKAI